MSKTKTLVLVSAIALVITGGGTFLVIRQVMASRETEPAAPEPYKVDGDTIAASADAIKTAAIEYYQVKPQDVPSTLTLSGRTDLDQERVTHVHAQFPGKVVQVGMPDRPLQLGDIVSSGKIRWNGWLPYFGPDTLCSIESTDLANAKAAYLQADVQLKLDIANRNRTEMLLEKKVLAPKYLEDAEAAVTKDRALLDATRQQLLIFGLTDEDFKSISTQQGKERMTYRLTSPRTGMIVEKGVVGGELADPTLNLFTVADTTKLWVWGDVYERDRPRVREGQKMQVILTSDPEHPRTCTVKWISPVIDVNTRAIKIRGELDNSDGRLLAQMYATLVVTISQGVGSIVVPADAIVRKGPQAFAFVVVKNESGKTTWRRTPVTVEPINAGPGLESLPVVSHNNLSPARGAGGATLRVTAGLSNGETIVQCGALGLFNEMEQQQSQVAAK